MRPKIGCRQTCVFHNSRVTYHSFQFTFWPYARRHRTFSLVETSRNTFLVSTICCCPRLNDFESRINAKNEKRMPEMWESDRRRQPSSTFPQRLFKRYRCMGKNRMRPYPEHVMYEEAFITRTTNFSLGILPRHGFSDGNMVVYNMRLMVICFPTWLWVWQYLYILFSWGEMCTINFLRWNIKARLFQTDLGSNWKSSCVWLPTNRFWACTNLSNILVKFRGLKPQLVSELATERHF